MQDELPLLGIDHIRLFVGNARQSAYFYRNAFGFDVVGYAGLETGLRDEAGYVLKQGDITLVLISPLSKDHPENRRLIEHGDGVMDVAFTVPDVDHAYQFTTSRGAIGVREPSCREDGFGIYKTAVIQSYGDTTHTFVERKNYNGVFAPGFRKLDAGRYSPRTFKPVGLAAIDHVVGNVELGKMDEWVHFYEHTMGFAQLVHFDDKAISTEYTALMSKVVQGGNGRIKFPLNEPAQGRKKSQVEEYLDYYGGPGVQHVAISTNNIIDTVQALRHNDVTFINVPPTYYEMLPERIGQIDEDLKTIEELSILVDRDEEGYLLQIFTQPVEDRPTLFFEIIERHGSTSFGKGNFKALFEAIEREQARRGTL